MLKLNQEKSLFAKKHLLCLITLLLFTVVWAYGAPRTRVSSRSALFQDTASALSFNPFTLRSTRISFSTLDIVVLALGDGYESMDETLSSLRPPIRVPYRPSLRSAFRPMW